MDDNHYKVEANLLENSSEYLPKYQPIKNYVINISAINPQCNKTVVKCHASEEATICLPANKSSSNTHWMITTLLFYQ